MSHYKTVEQEVNYLLQKSASKTNQGSQYQKFNKMYQNQPLNNIAYNHPNTLYSFLPNNSIVYSRNEQFTQLETQMKIDSIVKQYELKLEKQKEFYQLKQFKFRQEIKQLQSRLLRANSACSPRKRLDESVVNNYCEICSNGEINKHLKNMLDQVQESHKLCIAQKKNNLEVISVLKAKLNVIQQDNQKLLQQNNRFRKEINSMIHIQHSYQVDKRSWQKKERQRQKQERQRQDHLIRQCQHQRKLRKQGESKKLQFQRYKQIQSAKQKQRNKYRNYTTKSNFKEAPANLQQANRQNREDKSFDKMDKSFDKSLNSVSNTPINSKNSLQILKRQLKEQFRSSFPKSGQQQVIQQKQNKYEDIMSKLLYSDREGFEINPKSKVNRNTNKNIIINRKINMLQQQNTNLGERVVKEIVSKRKQQTGLPSRGSLKYLPDEDKPKSYSFMFH